MWQKEPKVACCNPFTNKNEPEMSSFPWLELPVKLAFQWDVIRLISRCDIVWFLKHARIQFGSSIYSVHCALNGKLEKKFSLKHGFFSTEKSIIQNLVQWIFIFLFFWDWSGNADCQLNLCLVRYWQQHVLFYYYFF